MGRKAFGPSKKKACDFKKCLKEKKMHEAKQGETGPLLHPRAFVRSEEEAIRTSE